MFADRGGERLRRTRKAIFFSYVRGRWAWIKSLSGGGGEKSENYTLASHILAVTHDPSGGKWVA